MNVLWQRWDPSWALRGMYDLSKLRRQSNCASNHTKVGISHTYSRAHKEIYLSGVKHFLLRFLLGHASGCLYFPGKSLFEHTPGLFPHTFPLKGRELFNCWILKKGPSKLLWLSDLLVSIGGTFSRGLLLQGKPEVVRLSMTRQVSRANEVRD